MLYWHTKLAFSGISKKKKIETFQCALEFQCNRINRYTNQKIIIIILYSSTSNFVCVSDLKVSSGMCS